MESESNEKYIDPLTNLQIKIIESIHNSFYQKHKSLSIWPVVLGECQTNPRL